MIRDAKILEAYVRDLLDSMPDASFMINASGRIVLANALIEKMLGYESQELIGKPIEALVPERFRGPHAGHCADYFARPRTRAMGVELGLRALCKDGTELPVEISLGPIESDEGIFVIGSMRDISQSEERYRAIFEQVAVGVVYSNLEGRILQVNPKFCAMTGYTREEALTLSIREFTHPDDIEKSIEARKRVMLEITSDYAREARLIQKDGTVIWTHITTSLVKGVDHRPQHFISVIHNIGEQKQAERERIESEGRFRAVLEQSIAAIYVLQDDRIVYVNARMRDIFGYAPDEAFDPNPLAHVKQSDWPKVIEQVRQRLVGMGKPAYTITALRKDHSEFTLGVNATRAVYDGGPAIIAVAQDITERERDEQMLRAAQEQFHSVVEQSITGIYIIQDNRFVYVNARLTEIFGYALPNEIIGLESLLLVAESDRALVKEKIRQRIDGIEKSLSYTFTGLRKDGSTFDVGVHGSVANYLGHVAVVGVLQDISEKKRAEGQIRRYIAQLEQAVMRTVEVAMTLSELRDPYTAGHEKRVAELAVAIGTELGFEAIRLQGLRVGGYLHDIGKMIIPAEILAKPTKLTRTEYELVKGHPQAGFDVLKDVEFPWPVAQIAYQHHERMDGSGYPQGLKGEAILLEARIVAVADVVEAMSSHRPYRPGLGMGKALAEIERGRGSSYDPNIVDVCLKVFQRGYVIPG